MPDNFNITEGTGTAMAAKEYAGAKYQRIVPTVDVGGVPTPVSASVPMPTAISAYASRIDDAGSGVTYVGEAAAGSGAASSVWRIKRITETGADAVIEWAGGVATFTKVWNSRAGYSYS